MELISSKISLLLRSFSFTREVLSPEALLEIFKLILVFLLEMVAKSILK